MRFRCQSQTLDFRQKENCNFPLLLSVMAGNCERSFFFWRRVVVDVLACAEMGFVECCEQYCLHYAQQSMRRQLIRTKCTVWLNFWVEQLHRYYTLKCSVQTTNCKTFRFEFLWQNYYFSCDVKLFIASHDMLSQRSSDSPATDKRLGTEAKVVNIQHSYLFLIKPIANLQSVEVELIAIEIRLLTQFWFDMHVAAFSFASITSKQSEVGATLVRW